MEERAGMQLRLQETVELLSIAAITYYLVSLLSYFLGGIEQDFIKASSRAADRLSADHCRFLFIVLRRAAGLKQPGIKRNINVAGVASLCWPSDRLMMITGTSPARMITKAGNAAASSISSLAN